MAERELQTAGFLDDAYDSVAGAADHLAGSTDEAVARTFDDEEGGGIIDGTAGFFDHAAGSIDESIGRTFDDQEGGGVVDGLVNTVTLGSLGNNSQNQGDSDVPGYIQNMDASMEEVDTAVQPGGQALHTVRLSNGNGVIPDDAIDRRAPDARDIVSEEGIALGLGAAGAAAATGAVSGFSAGSIVPGIGNAAGTVVGAAAGITGSVLGAQVEQAVGSVGVLTTAVVQTEEGYAGQNVTSVGVPPAGIGQNNKTIELTHPVPEEPGEYTVRVVSQGFQSENIIKTMEFPITVEEDTPETNIDDDGNGGNGDGGFSIMNFARNNPAAAGAIGVGSLIAVNAFATGAGEGIVQ